MKTINLNIKSELGKTIMTRNSVQFLFNKIQSKLLTGVSDNTKVCFDFSGVNFVSRAAIHEFYHSSLELDGKGVFVVFEKLSSDIESMLELVKSSKQSSRTPILQRYYISNSTEFVSLISA
jgi:anti-anti-sigma regulatory factor